MPEIKKQDISDIKRNLSISLGQNKTYLIVLAVHSQNNKSQYFSTSKGEPIGGCVYDMMQNRFQVFCEDYISLGWLSVSYEMVVSKSNWRIRVPAPLVVLKRHMSEKQLLDLKKFHATYRKHEFQYLQLVSK